MESSAVVHSFECSRYELGPQITAKHPISRLGTPEEIAQAVVWLCADAATFVAGRAIAVGGGCTTQ
jgi:NAD(P)-dependent dehydrogenase (short-subunit alcohol dehydrogenase family)